jgi:Spy/CpxP family protein refolding chaperone
MSHPRWVRVALLALVAALAMAPSAGAQEKQRRGGGGGGLGGRGMMVPGMDALALLNQEAVQKELKLSTDQTTKVHDSATEAMSEMREIFSGLQDLSPEERREKMQELRGDAEKKVKELRAKVDEVLDAAQKARLKQLVLQRRGVLGALEDPEVATALSLTDEQKKKLEELRPARGQGGRGAGGGGGGGGGGDREQAVARFQAAQKERNEKALAILTAEQKAALEKLQGPKFDFPAVGPGGRFPGA